MDWNAFLYLLLLIFVAYAPYKYLQITGRLLNASFQKATILVILFSTCITLLFMNVNSSSVIINPILIVGTGMLVLLWLLVPIILPKMGQCPKKALLPPKNLVIVSAHPPIFYLKFFEIVFQEVIFHDPPWILSCSHDIFLDE